MNHTDRLLMCGNCGTVTFRIYHTDQQEGGGTPGGGCSFEGSLLTECTKCGAASIITIQPATLKVDFDEGSQGCLCPKL